MEAGDMNQEALSCVQEGGKEDQPQAVGIRTGRMKERQETFQRKTVGKPGAWIVKAKEGSKSCSPDSDSKPETKVISN